jgi:putative membrane protein insertion efficiency factor
MNKYPFMLFILTLFFQGAQAQEPGAFTPSIDSSGIPRLLPYGPTSPDYEEKKLSESSCFDQANPLKLFLVLLISAYQNTFSKLDGSTCQFRPSCSHFGAGAIKRYGPFTGTLMTGDRLLRCNPFTRGKYQKDADHYHNLDPLEEHAP